MREKLTAYVRSLFRNAADTPRNRDLEEEILQNTLDRYDDLLADGASAESAYAQAVANIGNVESLLERPPVQYQPQREPQKKSAKRGALIAAVVVIGVLLLLLIGMLVLFGLNSTGHQSRGFGRYDDPEDRIENRFEAVEDRVEQWAEGVENAVEGAVESAIESGIAGFDYHYANEDSFSVGAVEAEAGNTNRLVIDWIAGSVTVETYDGDTISVSEPEQEKEKNRLRWRQEGDTLTIRYCASTGSGEVGSKDLTVKVPADLASTLRYVQINTVSADAYVSGLEISELQFDSTSGNLEFSGWAWDTEVDTVSGTAELSFADTPDELSFDSTSGDLVLFLPDKRDFEVSFETVSGDFHNNFGTYRQHDGEMYFEGTNRGKLAELEFDTVSGDVRIEKAPES